MHTELIDYFKKHGLYTISEIKDLEHSPCANNSNSVIDLLDAKTIHYGQQRYTQALKSVTGLYITSGGELLFIQTVSYDKPIEDFLKKFSQQKYINKVESTVEVLDDMVGFFGFSQDFESYLQKINAPKVKTILLLDTPIEDFLAIRLTFGDELNIGTNNPVTDDIIIMTCEEFSNAYC